MKTRLVEVTNGPMNWGKFLLGAFDNEWEYRSAVDSELLVAGRGWDRKSLLVLDLQTGEGAIFYPGGYAKADLDKRNAVYVEYDEHGDPYPVGGPGFERFVAATDREQARMDEVENEPRAVALQDQDDASNGPSRRPEEAMLQGLWRDGSEEVLREPQAQLQPVQEVSEREVPGEVSSESLGCTPVHGEQVQQMRLQTLHGSAALSSPGSKKEGSELEAPKSKAPRSNQGGAEEVHSGLRKLPRRDPRWHGVGIWVCPMFEPFLTWLYKQPDPFAIPAHVDLPDAPFAMQGYRRSGPVDREDS
jgi:hypothetical protein